MPEKSCSLERYHNPIDSGVDQTHIDRQISQQVRLQSRHHASISRTTSGLHTIDIITPPRPSSPPHSTHPHTRVLTQITKHASNSRLALIVDATSEFTQDSNLFVILQPLRRSCHALLS